MKTFQVCLIANNEAANWTSWEPKIAAIRDFYASKCELDITLVKSALKPVFSPYEPGIYVVDPVWYDTNVLPLAGNAQIVMFVVPPSDHSVPCLGGIETGETNDIWKTTVFSDENSSNYVDEVEQGNNFATVACHELSHAFYAMLSGVNGGPNDNTHKYFYSGNPNGVLQDFNFGVSLAGLYAQLIALLTKLRDTLISKEPSVTVDMSKFQAFLDAIVAYEGANPANNNPFDFRYYPGGYLPKYGPVGESEKGFAMFKTYDLGYLYGKTCITEMIQNHPQWTFNDFFNRYAPPFENDTSAYASHIAAQLGVEAGANLKSTLNI